MFTTKIIYVSAGEDGKIKALLMLNKYNKQLMASNVILL